MNKNFYIKGEYILIMFIMALIISGILILYLSTMPTCAEVAAAKCMEYCISQKCICQ